MIILLLGATGFIGKVLLERLLHDKDVKAVYVLMRGSKKFPNVEDRKLKAANVSKIVRDYSTRRKSLPLRGILQTLKIWEWIS